LKFVFELQLAPVIDKLDARIHLPLFHLGIWRNIPKPLRGVSADEVLALAWQRFQALEFRLLISFLLCET
jgi:hypothetical protein